MEQKRGRRMGMRKGIVAATLATIAMTPAATSGQSRVDVVISPDGGVSVNGKQVAPGRAPTQTARPYAAPYRNAPAEIVYETPKADEDVDRYESRQGDPIVVRRSSNGHFVVGLVVNGVPIRAAVDTGAINTFMTTKDAIATGAFRNTVDAIPAYGIAGSFMTTRVRLDEANIGGVDLGHPLVLVGQGINITLLGLPEIARLGRIVIDGNLMTITPRRRG
jgi:clan AA aspartic protease (TIGR02281 family)